MQIPSPEELVGRLRRLPAGRVLLERLERDAPVYLVGGAVRDLLLEVTPPDLDLVIEGDALAFAKRLDPGARAHDRFGTATFAVDGFTFDIARARRERYPAPGALPEVEPAGLTDDLLRRDFTVNAIAMALAAPEPGALKAAPGAYDDLSAGRLRVLHDASFIDDPTRLLRLARYVGRLGFKVEERTAALAAQAVAGGALSLVSGARIGAELRLLSREDDPVAACCALGHFVVAAAIHPRLGLADRERAHTALDILDGHGRHDLLVLALLADRVASDELPGLLDQLAFEAGERRVIVAAATQARALADQLAAAARPSEVAEAIGDAPAELVAAAGALGPREPAERWLTELQHVRLEIDGSDLRAAGIPEGPAIGRGLRAALKAKLDGRVDGREAELREALLAAADSQ